MLTEETLTVERIDKWIYFNWESVGTPPDCSWSVGGFISGDTETQTLVVMHFMADNIFDALLPVNWDISWGHYSEC